LGKNVNINSQAAEKKGVAA